MSSSPPKKLQLHRESLRRLTPGELRRAGGVYSLSLCDTRCETDAPTVCCGFMTVGCATVAEESQTPICIPT